MDNKTLIVLPLAVLALVNPSTLNAQGSDLPISYHLSTTRIGHFAPRTAVSPRISTKLAPSGVIGVDADLPEAPYHSRLLSGASVPKMKTFSTDWINGTLTFSTTRAKSLRDIYASKLSGFKRFSAAEANIGIVEAVGPRDTLALSASYALERRRPSLFLGQHNVYHSQDMAITTFWTHDKQFGLGISAFDVHPNGTRNNLERVVEVGGGAPLAVRGLALYASFSPMHNLQTFSIGFDVRQQQRSTRDAELIGPSSTRSETRLALVLRHAI